MEITAKIAEKKVFLEGSLKAAGDADSESQLCKQLAMEISVLEEKRAQRKRKFEKV